MKADGFISREDLPYGGSALILCGAAGGDPLTRLLSLARALRDGQGIVPGFAVRATALLAPIREAGFEARDCAEDSSLAALVAAQRPDILILEPSSGLSRGTAQALRSAVTLVAAINDVSDVRQACDFAYYPPLPQALALGWAGARTVPRIGWDYSLLAMEPHLAPPRPPGSRPTLLVTMGSDDLMGLTARAARLLAPLDAVFRIRFVIGGGMKDAGAVAASIVALKNNYETVEGASDLSTEYAAADLALCAFGGAAFELAAFGVPALYLAATDDQARTAGAFDDAGMGITLGIAAHVPDEEILGAVRALMNNAGRRREMRRAGLAIMDGGGAARIAADLALALREEKAPLKVAR